MEETHGTTEEQPDEAPSPKSKTWPVGVPALRLYRRKSVFDLPPELRAAAAPPQHTDTPPRLLRAGRALVGLALLALAWLGLYLVAALVMAVWHVLPIQRLSFNLLVSGLELVGACWIGMAALGCLFAGAFCVMLALTRRRW